MDNYKLEVLKNGIKVITVQHPKAQLIYFKLSLNIGSDVEAYKDKSKEIAHFLEHIFATFTSKKYPSALKNNELFAKLGVYVNASVTEKMSTYILKIPPDNFLKVIDIIYNSILNFKVDEAIFKQEKHAIKEELNDILNDTWINLEEDVNKILYQNHPRSVGEKDRIKMVKAASPSELTNFFKKYYRTNNMCLGIYGNVTNELRKSITEKFSKLNETCAINYNKYLYTNSNLKTNTIHFTKCPNAESYNLIIIFRIEHLYFSLEQDIAEGILNILTSDLESILTKRLRTKEGLVYNVDSNIDYDEFSTHLSCLNISTTVEGKNIQKVLNIIFEELVNLKTKLIKTEELTKYKAALRSEFKDRVTNRSPFSILGYYIHHALWDKKMVTYKEYYSKISSLSKLQIKNYAERFFISDNLIVSYGGKTRVSLKIPPNL